MYQPFDDLRELPSDRIATPKYLLITVQHLTVKGGFEVR